MREERDARGGKIDASYVRRLEPKLLISVIRATEIAKQSRLVINRYRSPSSSTSKKLSDLFQTTGSDWLSKGTRESNLEIEGLFDI